jgi:flavodoxin
MQQVIISIAYHTRQGHTKQIAEILAENMQLAFSRVYVVTVDKVNKDFETSRI